MTATAFAFSVRSRLENELANAERQKIAALAQLELLDELSREAGLLATLTQADVRQAATVAKLTSLGPTEAALWAITTYGEHRTLTSADVREILRVAGYAPRGGCFELTLVKSLRRLAESGRVLGQRLSDHWTFRAKPALVAAS